jgi:hypothetical protein
MNSSPLNILFTGALMAFAFGASTPSTAHAQTWQHPGVLVSQAQLDTIEEQYVAGNPVIVSQVLMAQKSNYGSLTYVPQGPWPGGVEQCGSYSSPDDGCSYGDDDSGAAYVQALLWYITGNKTYAANAINIMNAYARGMKGFAGFTPGYPCPASCTNGPLQAAWDAEKWPRAAEIIRYGKGGSAGWAQADITAFSNMLHNIYEPLIYNGSDYNGNWELSMVEAMMGIAVFNEDAALLAHAREYWTQRVPAYFYYQPLDGDTQPPFPPGRQGGATWNGQLIFNSITSGVAQETCRDLKHTEDGIAASINAAETDYIQGGILYTANGSEDRLVRSLNLMAGMESAASTSAPTDFCTGHEDKLELGAGTTYVIGYNEYHNRLHDPNMQDSSGSTGLNGTANTYNWIQKGLLPQTIYSDQGNHMVLFEALTHYVNAPSVAGANITIVANSKTMVAGSSIPALTYSVVPGTALTTDPACTTTATGSSPAGSYPIVCSGAALAGYTFSYVAGTLTVTQGTSMTITAESRTMTYGDSLPALKYTKTPSLSLTTNPACITTATSASLPGAYPITCSGAVKPGFVFHYVAGTLTINPLAVTISAKAQHMKPGTAVPALTYKVDPGSAILTTTPKCVTTATSGSPLGTYPITCSGAVGTGDIFTYAAATLTVED